MQSILNYLLLSTWIFLFGCSGSVSKRPGLDGTYQIITENDRQYELQLVTAIDSFVYGTIDLQSDTAHFDAPLVLIPSSTDSLKVEFWYGKRFLALSQIETGWKGLAKIEKDTVQVTVEKLSSQVADDLRASAEIIPLPLEAEAPAYTAHKTDGRMYVIGWADGEISLAEETPEGWREQAVSYDQATYRFSAIGLSPDEKMLVAHGRPKGQAIEAEKGGAIYLLHLADEYTVDSIEVLPMTVNTASYDNFPDFTKDGDIIFSSWGSVAGEKGAGSGDLYRAVSTNFGWQTEAFSDVLNTEMADAGPTLNNREDVIFFHRMGETPPLTADKLFASKKIGERWQEAIYLPAPINVSHSGQYGPRLDKKEEYFYWTSHHRGRGHLYRLPLGKVPELLNLLND